MTDMNANAPATQFAPAAYDAGLGDAWAGNCRSVVEAIRFCRQYAKVISERDERLSTGRLVHSEAYIAQCERLLPWQLSVYLGHVRAVSEAEAKMDAIGMAYAISSDDWRA